MISKAKNEHFNPYPHGVWNLEGGGRGGGSLLPKYLLDLHENWYSKVFLDEESNKHGFKIEK